ncbi:uncharacterized protein M421DRAFT_55160 [Didymella exigua CBS 183.55]|uniref:Uncharacterized protein n=1 Tax=Didymella exigua CBS 183.55 TaxID=1150837 RepID=A0A6A5RW01_9PLEO|nr:uncharacterized protein M421DRAFT_55160 [Didymella exigua CBS 183.55]KAF1932042.1 hypothetical protein M421DRAFT_55160 [Didymella exigua CBS 183.55]
MFKAQVLRRGFSVFNRVPTSRIVQSAARHGHETITIHRVRIRKPFLSRQRLVGAVAIAAAAYGLGQYLGLEVEIEEAEVEERRKPGRWKKQDEGEEGEEDEDEEEYDDAILFLPTGFSRLKPKTFYRGSDPEWQEFKKVTQDKARIERIRRELVTMVRTSPGLKEKLGEIDHKRGRAWIEFRFPEGPPPEYERPGYELTEDLEWRKTTRDVEPMHHHRLKKLLYPTAAAGAVYEDTKKKAVRSWNEFEVYMGWAEKTTVPTVQQTIQQVGNTTPPPSPATPPGTAAPASPFGAALPGATQQPAGQPSPPAAGTGKDLASITLPDAKALTLDLGQFRKEFHKANHKGVQHHIPRGAFGVFALIEVCGSKARLTMNVLGIYDPKVGRYVAMNANVWNQVANRQSPRGGP